MTQSKKTNPNDYVITFDDDIDLSSIETITVDIKDNYGTTATTTYWDGDSMVDTISTDTGTFTISANDDITFNNNYSWTLTEDTYILPDQVERMCKEYPGLEKVWRNFKSVYDMCKQDYEGKKKAGELDDDIPF